MANEIEATSIADAEWPPDLQALLVSELLLGDVVERLVRLEPRGASPSERSDSADLVPAEDKS